MCEMKMFYLEFVKMLSVGYGAELQKSQNIAINITDLFPSRVVVISRFWGDLWDKEITSYKK